MKHITLVLILSLLLFGCGKKAVKPKPPADFRPVSHQVTEIESTSSAESLLRATGKGSSVEYAIADARKASIWFLLYAGSKPLLKTSVEKTNMKHFEEKLYNNVDVYIRHTSPIKSKRKEGDTTIVEVLTRVDVAMLREFLVENSVIKASEDIADSIGLPSISIVTAKSDQGANIARNTLGEYLTDRDYEVTVVEQSGKLSKIVGKLSKLSGSADPAYAWALEAGNDVYIEVSANTQTGKVSGVETKKASVTAKAFETSTARQLASTSGHSSERAASGHDTLIQEAANNVADKLISQIRKAWLKESKKGKWFKLVAFTSEEDANNIDRSLYRALKTLPAAKVKRLAAGKNTFQYQVRAQEVANAFELLDLLSQKYNGPGKLSRELETGTLLVIKAGSGDIEIEFD